MAWIQTDAKSQQTPNYEKPYFYEREKVYPGLAWKRLTITPGKWQQKSWILMVIRNPLHFTQLFNF